MNARPSPVAGAAITEIIATLRTNNLEPRVTGIEQVAESCLPVVRMRLLKGPTTLQAAARSRSVS